MESLDKKTSKSSSGTQFLARAITYRPPALLSNGEMSVCQNFRNTYPGIRKRLGLSLAGGNDTSFDLFAVCNPTEGQTNPSTSFKAIRDGNSDGGVDAFIWDFEGGDYQVGNILTFVGGNNDCTIEVMEVSDPEGWIERYKILTPGSGYSLYDICELSGGDGLYASAIVVRVLDGDARTSPETVDATPEVEGTSQVSVYADGTEKTIHRGVLTFYSYYSKTHIPFLADFNYANLSLTPISYLSELPPGSHMPRLCLVRFTQLGGSDSSDIAVYDPFISPGTHYQFQHYQNFFGMEPLGPEVGDPNSTPVFTLISDDIIDTSDLNPGDVISFDFNAAGLAYLNTTKLSPPYPASKWEFGVIEYDHDYLGVEIPQTTESVVKYLVPTQSEISCVDSMHPNLTGTYVGEEATSIYQFSKTRDPMVLNTETPPPGPKESYTFLSTRTGNVYGLPDIPITSAPEPYPSPVADVPAVLPGSTEPSCLPSWGTVNDMLILSAAGHSIYAGMERIVSGAWACYTESFEEGVDIWENVVDSGTLSADIDVITQPCVGILICTQTPADRFRWDILFNETSGSVARVLYLSEEFSWIDATVVLDETQNSGCSMVLPGDMVFTKEHPEVPAEFFGITGFWYRIVPIGAFATIQVNQLTYGNMSFIPIQNVWDGVPADIIEAQVHIPASGLVPEAYYTYAASLINLSLLPADAYVYFSTTEPISEIMVNVGASPNVATDREITWFDVWDGATWYALSFDDTTEGLAHSGRIFITDQPDTYTPETYKFNGAQLASYWYRFRTGYAMSAAVTIGITYSPQIKKIIDQFGTGTCSCVWKDRVAYAFDRYPSDLYVTAGGTPNVLNGNDYAVLSAGDGRKNRIVCMKKFHNELMVWQEERGQEGGCLTLFEGYSPATFGKLMISSKVGCVNSPQACVVVDGSAAQTTRRDDVVQTRAYWVSHYGIYSSDGRTVSRISNDIQNYFDARDPDCIRRGYEWASWAQYDSSENVVRFGLVCGDSATSCNIFPVYDLTTGTWSFDSYDGGRTVTAMAEVSAMSGDIPVLQLAGGQSMFYQANVGLNDDGAPIRAISRSEMNSSAMLMDLREVMVRMKVQDGGTCEFSAYENGRLIDEHGESISMDAVEPGDTIRRERLIKGINQVHNISFEFSNDEVDKDLALYDYFIDFETIEER